MERFILSVLVAVLIVAAVVAAAFLLSGPSMGQSPARFLLVKIYAKAYQEETACLLDLEQAANMSPPGTRFKCERVSP